VSIPFEYASLFKLKEGDTILIDKTQNGILIIPAEVKPRR